MRKLIVLLALTVPLWAQPAGPVPQSFFGMHTAVSTTSITSPAPYGTPILSPVVIGSLGKGVGNLWPVTEPAEGVFDFSRIDNFDNWAIGHGVDYFVPSSAVPYYTLGVADPTTRVGASSFPTCTASAFTYLSNPIYYCYGTLTSQGLTDIADYNTRLATRFKGKSVFYEGFNEPPFTATTPSLTLTTTIQVPIETARYNALKAADPSAKVCSPAFIIDPAHPSYATFMDNFLTAWNVANPGVQFDCYDFHINETNPEDQIADVNQFKSILTSHSITNKPIYATESGRWGDCPDTVSDDTAEAYIARIEMLYWSLGVTRHYWYAYDTCGTLTNQTGVSTLKPPGITYGVVENWMVGATMTVSPANSGTVWTTTFTRPGGYEARAVWDTSGSSTYTAPSKFVSYLDVNGNSAPIVAHTVTIGMKPLLLQTGIGTPVLLDLTDRSGVTRTGNVVLALVPMAESFAVTDVRNVAITTAPAGACSGGVQIDSHRLVTERWHGDPDDTSKTIKAMLVAVDAPTLTASGTAHVCVSDRSGADPGTATTVTVNSSDTCADTTACTTVSTGVNKYWIRHDYFNLFDQVRRLSDNHDYVTHSSTGGIVAVTSAGTFTSATVPTATPGIPGYSISTEQPSGASTANEDGANLWAQVKVSGALWSGGTPKFTYVGRLYFFGGDGSWLWKGTNIYSEDMFATSNQPTSVGLFIPTTLGASLTAKFGTLYGTTGTSTSVSMTNSDDVYLSQYDHGNKVSNTAPTIGTTTSAAAPFYVCDDVAASNAASSANCSGLTLGGWRVVKGTATQATGNQSGGWASCDDGSNQGNVWMRDHWQNYPVEFECNGDTIGVYQWPKHGDTHVDGRSTGDLTAITNYKLDMARANQTGFGHTWPWNPGAAMNMTVQSPNPGRGFFSLVDSASGHPVVLSGAGVNYKMNDSPCNGAGCNFWTACTLSGGVCTYDSTKARRVYVSGFTSGWTALNGYLMAMWNGSTTPFGLNNFPQLALFTTGGVPIDVSAFGAIPAGCLGTPGTCKIGTLDTNTDAQADSFGRSWEVAGNFTSSGTAAPGNDAARWRDTLLFTNPTYFCDTSLFMGRVHKQDIANFARTEAEITNYFNNLYKRQVVQNVFGIYYGLELYGGVATGFGGRYFASLSRRRFDVGLWLQFMRTGDPTFFHRGEATLQAAEVQTHHPPQVNVTSAYAGVGLDHTGTADSNRFWDTKHYVDANNNSVVKHDGSTICTESAGADVFFSVYNSPPSALTHPGGSNVNPCSDGQQPTLDYATTSLRLDYDFTGNPRSKELLQSTVNNVIFSATAGEGAGKIRTLVLDENSHIYDGGCFGRAFAGGMQSSTDAAELLGNGTVNYIDLGDRCFAANIQDSTAGINVWTQNPTGLLYDDAGIGPNSATPSVNAHTHYGSHYFANIWSYWSFPEYVSYKGNASISAPSYATGHAAVNVQTAMNNMANGVMGYFNTTTRAGGLYTLIFPARIASDSYALTGDSEFLKYIKRGLDFHTDGADDVPTDTGCGQSGTASTVGDTPSVPPVLCSSPTASAGNPPFDLHSTTNPNAIGYSTPDIHSGGPLSIGLAYLMQPAGVLAASAPDFPPSFVNVPAVGAANAPLKWITNVAGTPFTFDLALRIAVASDFGNLSIVTPISGDFSLTVVDSTGASVSGVTLSDSAGDTYTCSPTCIFKTPTQMWPAAPGGGTGACLAAVAPPSINFTSDGLNNKDNRVFHGSVPNPGILSGEYKIQLTYANCSDPNGLQIPVASILGMSTGNVDLVTCTSPCNAIGQFQKGENGSVQYANIAAGVSKFQVDSSTRFALTAPPGSQSGGLYRGGTVRTIPALPGAWAIKQNGGWQSESSFVLTHGGLGGVKPLLSPSPQTFYDSPNYSNQTFVSNANNPITLNFSGCAITTASPLHSGTSGVLYSPNVTETVAGCGSGTASWSISAGALPPGMSLSSAGIISGTPTAAGTFNFTVHVSGLAAPTPSDSPQQVTIAAGAPCVVSTVSPLHSGTSGTAYSPTVQETTTGCGAGTPSWSVSAGALPTGMSLSSSGLVSGTPSVSGLFSFTVSVSGLASTPTPAAQQVTINPGVPCVNTTTNPLHSGTNGSVYSPTVQETTSGCGAGTPSWSVTAGALPTGLSLSSPGVISGTPTQTGLFNFTVSVSGLATTPPATAQQVTINAATPCLITTASPFPDATTGSSYGPVIETTSGCGAGTAAWSITSGALPNGITLSSGGSVSGSPTQTGVFNFTASVSGLASTPTPAAQQMTVNAGSVCVITTTSCPNATTGTGYTCTVLTNGCLSPIHSIPSGLPSWASLNTSTGSITGTPSGATPTTSNFTDSVTDANGNPTQALSILDCVVPTITTTSPLTAATVGTPYVKAFAASGDTPVTWTATGVPAGLALDTSGNLTGTPTGAGVNTINVTATNACGFLPATPFALTIQTPAASNCPANSVCITGKVGAGGKIIKLN